jgi:hypothetical protein
LVLLLAAGRTVAAEPVDLSKLDRSIAKEPAYTSKAQEYCLVVFGPKAETRVWLVRDGDALYVDRNGNGDLTEPGEAMRKERDYFALNLGAVTSRDGKTIYQSLSLTNYGDGYRLRVNVPGKMVQLVGVMRAEKLRFASGAKDAPIIHFDGPLALAPFAAKDFIPRDAGPVNNRGRSLRVMIGSAGLGSGTFAAYNCRVCDDLGPLMADFSFRSASGGPQIEFTHALEKIG